MAKTEYQLLPNETIIMKSEQVYRGNVSGELVLTNLNLIHTTKVKKVKLLAAGILSEDEFNAKKKEIMSL